LTEKRPKFGQILKNKVIVGSSIDSIKMTSISINKDFHSIIIVQLVTKILHS
jgi:hypothetical protein